MSGEREVSVSRLKNGHCTSIKDLDNRFYCTCCLELVLFMDHISSMLGFHTFIECLKFDVYFLSFWLSMVAKVDTAHLRSDLRGHAVLFE